jgi:hypothetical protein
MNLPCPSCGFLTVDDETYGTYNICEVCGWEDDQLQLANPCSGDGANSESLYESQLQALKEVPVEINEYEGICRSSVWRPLNQKEIEEFTAQAKEKHWANKGVGYESEVYWSKNS